MFRYGICWSDDRRIKKSALGERRRTWSCYNIFLETRVHVAIETPLPALLQHLCCKDIRRVFILFDRFRVLETGLFRPVHKFQLYTRSGNFSWPSTLWVNAVFYLYENFSKLLRLLWWADDCKMFSPLTHFQSIFYNINKRISRNRQNWKENNAYKSAKKITKLT